VVTLNRQRAVPQGWVIPDAWHHQMVYGVGPKGIYLTNPLEIVPDYVIQKQLCSESFLLIRRNDVVSRWQKDCNLGILLKQDDVRWQEMNVLGNTYQCVCVCMCVCVCVKIWIYDLSFICK